MPARSPTAWVDIENPPQVQYLVPLVDALRRRQLDVIVTARDYGDTLQLLEQRGVACIPVARHFGAAKLAKVSGTLRRVVELRRLLRKRRPDLLISASRSAALVARTYGFPSFAVCDYEYVNLSVFRATRSVIVHPDVIAVDSFTERGMHPEQLLAFPGIKEDLTFANVDIDAVTPHRFERLDPNGVKKALVRPPAEESHYYQSSSSEGLHQALEWLAGRTDLVTIYSPRYRWQSERLGAFDWKIPPIVLDGPVEFLSLYKAVDVVFSGGGTMAREAAYLGIPSVTIFRGSIGDVDRYLMSLGRVVLASRREDFDSLDPSQLRQLPALRSNPRAPDDVLDAILELATTRGLRAGARGAPEG